MAKAGTRRRRRGTRRKAVRGMGPWYVAAAVIIGGILAYDHRDKLDDLPGASQVAALLSPNAPKEATARVIPATPRAADRPRAKEHTGSIDRQTSSIAPPAPVGRPVEQQAKQIAALHPADGGTFYFCGIRHDNCVIDGDTFIYKGERILIADIDAPETKTAKCDAERSRGSYAKARLRELLNAGSFTLAAASDTKGDKEAGKPHLILRDGRSLGDIMAHEGLVKKRLGPPASWCGQSTARVSG